MSNDHNVAVIVVTFPVSLITLIYCPNCFVTRQRQKEAICYLLQTEKTAQRELVNQKIMMREREGEYNCFVGTVRRQWEEVVPVGIGAEERGVL